MHEVPPLQRLDPQHPRFLHRDADSGQVLAQRRIEARAIQQAFAVDRLAVGAPGNPPSGRRIGTGPCTGETGMTQAFEHPLRDALQGRETPPLADHAHRVAQPFQPQGDRSARRASAEHDDLSHGGAPAR